MSPLLRIALGLIVVVLRGDLDGWDLYPDPLGWLLILWGVWGLGERLPVGGLRGVALVAGLVSIPLTVPSVRADLSEPLLWAASLPQLVFCLLLCTLLRAAGREHDDPVVARRFGVLRWVFLLMTVLPVVAIGGGIDVLREPTDAVALIANAVLVFYLLVVHRRPWLGGPGPRTPRARTTS